MNLDTYDDPGALYRARGDEVQPERPLFTGDVFADVAIPATQETGMALILAHPCSFRRSGGQLAGTVLVCGVHRVEKVGNGAWKAGFLDRMPLPDLAGPGYWAALFDTLGRATAESLLGTQRLACLSDFGINMLQQRLTCHLTRAEIPTQLFNEGFSHTYEEAELLEEWTMTLGDAGFSPTTAAKSFEQFIRSGEPRTLQELLRDPQQRFTVRKAARRRAKEIAVATTDHPRAEAD